MQLKKKIIISAIALLSSHPALAQDALAVTINGDTEINANAENTATIAGGNGAVARTDIGVISNSTINGDTVINANARNTLTGAAGNNATAVTEIGAVNNAQIDGNTTINANADTTITTALGENSCAATRVGVVGKNPCPR